ncbi:glycosyltransferase [Spelaeicoccus albus]|nr:glycosyltransferase family 2 protein [Spelaeicoccus albus]
MAVIPAHNEQESLPGTLRSLAAQIYPVSPVVVPDNCTDDTAAVARHHGAAVMPTSGNTFKKAGALNQTIARLLPALNDDDFVLAIDADTSIVDTFVAEAVELMHRDSGVGAVGGVFVGEPPTNLLELAQSNEYVRYARQIDRTGRTMVLSGTASIIRVTALRQVAAARGDRLPGEHGDFYDRDALTEDMEIGLALKTLGWRLESPITCTCTTELMPTVSDLRAQRIRWYRGALENLVRYGLTRVTVRYWGQQLMLILGMMMIGLFLTLTTVDAVTGILRFSPIWTSICGIFVVERVVTAWKNGRKGRLLAACLVPELCYDLILQSSLIAAVAAAVRKKKAVWHHPTDKEKGTHHVWTTSIDRRSHEPGDDRIHGGAYVPRRLGLVDCRNRDHQHHAGHAAAQGSLTSLIERREQASRHHTNMRSPPH